MIDDQCENDDDDGNGDGDGGDYNYNNDDNHDHVDIYDHDYFLGACGPERELYYQAARHSTHWSGKTG